MSAKRVGYALIAFGVLAALVAVLADPLGIGNPGFGWKKGALLATGVSVVLGGLGVIGSSPPVAEVSAKRVGYAAIAFGVLAALVAVLADPLGIGGNEGFGWRQGLLLSSGVSVALGGVGVMRGWFTGLGPRRGAWERPTPIGGSSPLLIRSTGGDETGSSAD